MKNQRKRVAVTGIMVQQIIDARASKNWTQEMFAENSGISLSEVKRLKQRNLKPYLLILPTKLPRH